MPEIAEVALMAEAIREMLSGQQLSKIEVLGGRYSKGLDNLEKIMGILPLPVKNVNVKGKFCWIDLDNDWYIAITFGMSGGIYYEPTEEVLSSYSERNGKKITKDDYMKHFHVKFIASNGHCFYFGDPRRFGTIIISNNRNDLQKKLNDLGPDMLTGPLISDIEFIKIFRKPKFSDKNICKVLMEQHAVSGVGNYIKAEVLYECKISPWALVSDLDDVVLVQLHKSIRTIAQAAFIGHGASLYTYSGTRREKGEFQEMLKVYGKNTDPEGNLVVTIPEDHSPDKRTTHYVPKIQVIGNHRDPNNVQEKTIEPEPEPEPVKKRILITVKKTSTKII